MSTTIFHNPSCSKSRATLELLTNKGIQPTIIEYLKNPPTVEELRQVLQLLNLSPRELIRTNEVEYKSSGLDDPQLNDEQILELMAANPKVIQRPIVVTGTQARIGRPPESVLEII